MNHDELQEAVKRFGFDDSDPLTTWINAAIHDLEDASNWTFLENIFTTSTNATVDTLDVPSDLWTIHSIKILGQTEKLRYLSRNSWEDQILDDTTPGLPTHYTMVGLDTVLLWPVPDAIYSVRIFYRILVPELVGPNDVPSAFPNKLHFAIVQRAAAIGLGAENNEDRASSAQNQYEATVAAAATTASGDHQTSSFGQVQDAQEYGS